MTLAVPLLLQVAPAPVAVPQVRLVVLGVVPGVPLMMVHVMAAPMSVIVWICRFEIVVQVEGMTP